MMMYSDKKMSNLVDISAELMTSRSVFLLNGNCFLDNYSSFELFRLSLGKTNRAMVMVKN